ncbi:sugar phosphate isomerase [Spirochaetia bacterium]|nr:sugar phosphate isomerase [Spirochaetia bacterium]
MNVGLSIYSLLESIRSGKLTILDAMQWIKDNGGDHVEFVDFVVNLTGKDDLIKSIREKSETSGLAISAYSVSANLLQNDDDTYKKELDNAFKFIDTAHKLGAPVMRSDLYSVMTNFGKDDADFFEGSFQRLVKAARDLADYAKQYNITVTIENHGTMLNGSERVRRFVKAVGRDNYKVTLDVGNTLCVDERPDICVSALLPWAATVHFKDFYIRKDEIAIGTKYIDKSGKILDTPPETPGFGNIWFKTTHGRFLRGAIVGHGDIDIPEIVSILKAQGYNGNLTIEFEGIENCELACRAGLRNLNSIVRKYAAIR